MTSTAFNVTVGTASQLAFTTEPAGATGGSAFSTQPTVTIQDAGGNTVTTDTNAVTMAIGTNPSTGRAVDLHVDDDGRRGCLHRLHNQQGRYRLHVDGDGHR